jgi:hypothetical protein
MGTRRGSAEEDQSLCPICDELHPVSQIQVRKASARGRLGVGAACVLHRRVHAAAAHAVKLQKPVVYHAWLLQAHCEAHFAEEGGPPPQRVPELLERHSGQHPCAFIVVSIVQRMMRPWCCDVDSRGVRAVLVALVQRHAWRGLRWRWAAEAICCAAQPSLGQVCVMQMQIAPFCMQITYVACKILAASCNRSASTFQYQPASVDRADQIKPASTLRSGDDLIPLIVRCLESQGSSFTAAVTGA